MGLPSWSRGGCALGGVAVVRSGGKSLSSVLATSGLDAGCVGALCQGLLTGGGAGMKALAGTLLVLGFGRCLFLESALALSRASL